MAPQITFTVRVHPHASPNRGACAYEMGDEDSRNALIFIGGLGDGPHTVPYIRIVAEQLATTGKELDYSVFELRLRSSFIGFGTGSLKRDVEDIAALVRYLRSLGKQKIVLFGHSTGSQDCMEYANYERYRNPRVDGFIMQGPVSDRQAFEPLEPHVRAGLRLANEWIAHGRGADCLPMDLVPKDLGAPMSAYRLRSLLMKDGDDDYFSDDLDDETQSEFWGRFNKPVLVLMSEKDEYVPGKVHQQSQYLRYQWLSDMVSSHSGIIPGASHRVSEEDSRDWLARRVIEFLAEDVVRGRVLP